MGMYTNINGATITATVTGRYIGFANSVQTVATTASITTSVTVDGVAISTAIVRKGCGTSTPNAGSATLCTQTFLYDTNSSTPHNIVITNGAATILIIDYFFGFNNLVGTVLINSPEQADYGSYSAPYNLGSPARLLTMRTILKTACNKLRTIYNASVYYVEQSVSWPYGDKSDGVHPNPSGHQRIAARLNYVLNNGEYVDWV